jgi:non-ribosomal peptide synthetase component F
MKEPDARIAPADVVRLIERTAASVSEAIAVTYRGESVNYREVNRRANRLARTGKTVAEFMLPGGRQCSSRVGVAQ